jgi:hypothetical protein
MRNVRVFIMIFLYGLYNEEKRNKERISYKFFLKKKN